MTIYGAHPGSLPTNPYHIARAYGVQNASGIGPVKPVQRAVTTPIQPVDPIGRDTSTGALRDGNLQRLVAGVVPGGVSFDASGEARPTGSPIPFYRHPAEKNAAATAVSVGRSLDVQG